MNTCSTSISLCYFWILRTLWFVGAQLSTSFPLNTSRGRTLHKTMTPLNRYSFIIRSPGRLWTSELIVIWNFRFPSFLTTKKEIRYFVFGFVKRTVGNSRVGLKPRILRILRILRITSKTVYTKQWKLQIVVWLQLFIFLCCIFLFFLLGERMEAPDGWVPGAEGQSSGGTKAWQQGGESDPRQTTL